MLNYRINFRLWVLVVVSVLIAAIVAANSGGVLNLREFSSSNITGDNRLFLDFLERLTDG